jgi:fructose-bisphosphate aldolase, class II
MPVATPEEFEAMLAAARASSYAYPAVNVTSSQTLNAALRGFAEAGSDGIIQITTGGAEFASGGGAKSMALGARAIAEFAHVVGEHYPVLVALHTDHCTAEDLDRFVRPLLAESAARRTHGAPPLFTSHMFDGSQLPLRENLRIAAQLLEECAALDVVLELEIGVVGGEEDGIDAAGIPNERLYTTADDALAVADALGTGEWGRYLLAATFGNVHGHYAPGRVQLHPSLLAELQAALVSRRGGAARFDFVFHGGSGSSAEEIAEAVHHGVVKMNIDTDAQYAYTRAVAAHMFKYYDGVLKLEGGTGEKQQYDPRTWGRKAEAEMAGRVAEACRELGSAGRSLA